MTRRRTLAAVLTALLAVAGLSGCGGGSAPARPGPALAGFLSSWAHGNWAAMRRQVVGPPADLRSVNARVFDSLGVSGLSFGVGTLHEARSHRTARAQITEHWTLPGGHAWNPTSTVRLVLRRKRWLVAWTPRTINPALGDDETLAVSRHWPDRAPILGAGGVPLTQTADQVIVGVVGSRIKNAATVGADLIAAGAPRAAVAHALAAAKAAPEQFQAVETISAARFAALKAQSGADNVYAVPGTSFVPTSSVGAITPTVAANIVGTLGPITAEEVKSLGSPYEAGDVVGQTGIEQSAERTLAGTPSTHVDVVDAGGNPLQRLATFPGTRGHAVRTSIDPRVQRAAERALNSSTRPDVAMVAMRASTGQVLAVADHPVGGYDTALDGTYPPGSSFKILTSTALFTRGLTPDSAASCPLTINIDGETFHNAEGDQPVSDISQAFTESCNTAFIGAAVHHLSFGSFPAAAALYGLQRTTQIGLPAIKANVPRPTSETQLAGDSIGQGDVTFSPLGMADVAAAVDSGVARAPRLVVGAADDRIPASRLPAGIVASLRTMMANVVASGTASKVGLPAGTHAKTGTAEYGTGPESTQKIDGWLVGYRGDIAFAIVTHDTGGQDGGPVDGPIIARFLDSLG